MTKFSTSTVKGDLFKFQSQLPKLPSPPSKKHVPSTWNLSEPFLSSSQLETTKAHVEEFLQTGGPGEVLQKRLEDFAKDKRTIG